MCTCFAGSEDYYLPAAAERSEEGDISLRQNRLLQSPADMIFSSAPVDGLLMQRRRRFHGWISDNEADDKISPKELVPATAMQLERLIRGADAHSKSRWDEMPK